MSEKSCMPGCPSNANEHIEILCPSKTSCHGIPNDKYEHDCTICCCFPVLLLGYIITLPFCICNVVSLCCYKDDTVGTDLHAHGNDTGVTSNSQSRHSMEL